MSLQFADDKSVSTSIAVNIVEKHNLESCLDAGSDRIKAILVGRGFCAALGEIVEIYDDQGALEVVYVGYGDARARARGRFHLAKVGATLSEGCYRLVTELKGPVLEEAALGWLLSPYQFDRYKTAPPRKAKLLCPPGLDAARLEIMANAEAFTRDLVNTPANDMGPDALESACRESAGAQGAEFNIIVGDALLEEGFELIHTVGRAAVQTPRLIDMRWGSEGPRITLVGKGVCFDTGGLNVKPGNSMGLMKKDMGGAANVLGLAQMLMRLNKKIRLRVLIPAVENSIGGNALRPGDVLKARNGLSVEVNNTDAEGRLVLADALAFADEEKPDLILSMATLTGAARVALGADLAPFFSTDQGLCDAIRTGAKRSADPVWELPFWPPYETMIEPDIADLDNAPAGYFGGALTAALFLRRFVSPEMRYVHFDIFSWRQRASPGWAKGGLGQGQRAILHAFESFFDI